MDKVDYLFAGWILGFILLGIVIYSLYPGGLVSQEKVGNFICKSHGLGESKGLNFEDAKLKSVSCNPEKEILVTVKVEQ